MYKECKPFTPSDPVTHIIRLSDTTFIPIDQDNRDYQTYLKWLDGYEMQNGHWVKTSEGNTPEPADQSE